MAKGRINNMNNKKTISIIFPVHNEEENLPIIHKKVKDLWKNLDHKYKYEIIFVDDGSTDGSWKAIKKIKGIDKKIKGLHFSRNFGHQSAIEAGLQKARGEAIVMLDADGQHPVRVINNLIKKWEDGYAIINTIRKDDISTSM